MRKVAICSLFFAFLILGFSAPALAQVVVSVSFAPPALPVYEQPLCPGDGYLWTPGYWAWDDADADYYWVPGTWVEPPTVGMFWTPGYWGWGDDAFIFHEGYWSPQVGFYGGINYGFGFFGEGFVGGRWDGGHFFYNRDVANVNVTVIRNVYNERVTSVTENRVSFNGGNGGINVRPTAQEEAANRDRHIPPVAAQTQHVQAARQDRDLRASVNQGKPAIAATPRPGAFTDHEIVKAKEAGAPYSPPNRGGAAAAGNTNAAHSMPVHARDLPPMDHATAPNTGNPKVDQKYQQQQEKLYTQQSKERQRLQDQQDKEHQQLKNQKANDQRNQQLEQKHQQQTQQLMQRHTQQQQQLQQRQSPPAARGGENKPR